LALVSRNFLGVVLGSALAAAPRPAAASFSVCNDTDHPAAVALGYFDGEEWSTQGWWRVDARGCTELSRMPLIGRYYYLYAIHEEVGGSWNGNRSFCVGTQRFRIRGRADCLARGYDRKRFYQIDTRDAADWTETLSD
jgi:uncharacterized membrane protein